MHKSLRQSAIFILACFLLSGCTLGRFFIYNFADTKDHRKFPSRDLPASPTPFHYAEAAKEMELKTTNKDSIKFPFENTLADHKTVAFLVIHRDTIVYERYFKGYDPSRIHTSFSVAKSVISMLIGCAIEDGIIKGVDQPVTDFIPELKEKGFDKVTVENLLQMTSGLKFNESYYNPFGDAANFYYGRHLYKSMSRMKLKAAPGEHFEYQSGSSQLLGLVLERALRNANDPRTVTAYLNDKLWSPLGMEYPASWSIDQKEGGIEKTFCCINAPARAFAKLGSLYLHKGEWNGKQLVPKEWVEQSTRLDSTNGSDWSYQYQWWLPSREGDFEAQGILGQYIYVDPTRELVIVRLGTNYGNMNWSSVFRKIGKLFP
ncbi:MAG: serine hydrolase [Flavobacteriales bacterium]|nr:serine hydrolase [Flavobacteriales bacterium]